jgi:transcriptional regulator with XRE-family HTH domain
MSKTQTNTERTSRPQKTWKTSDALEIIDKTIVCDNAEFRELVEEATVNALVAQAIYDGRKSAGLTQAELADLIGTKQPVISQLEDADYEGHSLSMLKRIADALNQRLETPPFLHRTPWHAEERSLPQGWHREMIDVAGLIAPLLSGFPRLDVTQRYAQQGRPQRLAARACPVSVAIVYIWARTSATMAVFCLSAIGPPPVACCAPLRQERHPPLCLDGPVHGTCLSPSVATVPPTRSPGLRPACHRRLHTKASNPRVLPQSTARS